MNTYKTQIDAFIESQKDNIIQDIKDLIAIPSVARYDEEGHPYGRHVTEALSLFREKAQKMSFAATNLNDRVSFADYGPQPRKVDLLAHLDVVKALDDWTVTDPFTAVCIDGKIYGRGSADDKGPAVAALYAMYAVKELGIPLSRGVRIVAGGDEENNRNRDDLRHYLGAEGAAEATISPDADYPIINVEKGFLRGKITGEYEAPESSAPQILSIDGGTLRYIIPGTASATISGLRPEQLAPYIAEAKSKNDITISAAFKGENKITLTASGKETHVGAPEVGNNALTGMIDFLCSLPLSECGGLRMLRGINKLFPHGDWKGEAAGVARDTENSGCLLSTFNILHYTSTGFTGSYDMKIPVGCTEENTKNVLLANLRKEGLGSADCKQEAAHYVSLDSDLVKCLLSLYTEYSGQEGYGVAINGDTYVHTMENAVAFGCAMPGVDNRMHGADEFAEIDVLLMSAKILARAIVELCGETDRA